MTNEDKSNLLANQDMANQDMANEDESNQGVVQTPEVEYNYDLDEELERFGKFREARRALPWKEWTTMEKANYYMDRCFLWFLGIFLSIMLCHVNCRQLNMRAEATCDADRYYHKELKLAKSLALVVFLFALCWLPLHIMNCIIFFCPECHMPKIAMYVGIFMSHVNSALNPLVYAFRIKRFRVTLIQITRRCMLCKSAEQSPHPASTLGLTCTEKTAVNGNPCTQDCQLV